ncbi:MAG: putative acetyltransferase, partial [Bradymonadia bacterium]
MNVNALIDAIVRQTTVLIAHLATAAGVRAPLAHVANQIFLDLVTELRNQGVGGKVIADMFGMALRTYHARVRRLSESATDRGRTLWEAVLAYVQEQDLAQRTQVLHRFRYDDEATVRGVLNDLVESGMIFRAGRGERTVYRAAQAGDVADPTADPIEADATLVLVAINRFQPVSRADIEHVVRLEEGALAIALERLEGDGRATREAVKDGAEDGELWRCEECVIPFGTPVGWEAAVFDHYQALVTALCTKLRIG